MLLLSKFQSSTAHMCNKYHSHLDMNKMGGNAIRLKLTSL